ncbi:AAA family ATPase [Actinomadura fulvescens]|uniref:Thymidylate kinase n=1 Tax=Actinomadura fulvescens TaxID=46160 RepID=A0ABN3Q2N8_9ACTN
MEITRATRHFDLRFVPLTSFAVRSDHPKGCCAQMTPLAHSRDDHRFAQAPGPATNDPTPRFIVLEGLSCTGKSTIAPLLAERLGAVQLDTLVPDYEPVRRHIDATGSVPERLHFWLMANYAISRKVRDLLASGWSVVIESYFHRTLATHGALGVQDLPTIDWSEAQRPDAAVQLTVSEEQRRRRYQERDLHNGVSLWSRRIEANVEQVRRIYLSFGLTAFDTDGLGPMQVVDGLQQLLRTKLCGRHHA